VEAAAKPAFAIFNHIFFCMVVGGTGRSDLLGGVVHSTEVVEGTRPELAYCPEPSRVEVLSPRALVQMRASFSLGRVPCGR
jgi:hypothetical protein